MRKTLMALMFATALPTIAMAAQLETGAVGTPPPPPAPTSGLMAPPPPPPGGPMAGPGGPGFEGPGMHRHRGPFERLNLTPEQRQQVDTLMGDQRRERFEITQKYLAKLSPADQKAMQDEIVARHAKVDAGIRATLTPDQQKTFDQIQKDQEQRRAERAEFEAWKAQKAQKTQ